MRLVGRLKALCHGARWRLGRPVVGDVTLWNDAEFQITLCELRYPPIRRNSRLSHDKMFAQLRRPRDHSRFG